MSALEVIAKCVEHDYNRTFHDTALCVLADLKRAGYAIVELPKPTDINEWRDPMFDWNIRPRRAYKLDTALIVDCAITMSPGDVRPFAAALLAAADAADAAEVNS